MRNTGLVDEPSRYGWTWDGVIETYEGGLDDRLTEPIDNDTDIATYSTGARGTVTIEGRPVFAVGLEPGRGDLPVKAQHGRLPSTPQELALGRSAQRAIGAEIGDTVRATTIDGREIQLHVVGEALVPALNSSGMLGVLGAGILAHALLTAVAGRSRELALLKVIGFTRRGLSATVAVQATTLAGLAVVIGTPLGFVAGRWAWLAFADRVGVESAPLVPLAATALAVVAACAIANLIAAASVRRARRTPASVSLAVEQPR